MEREARKRVIKAAIDLIGAVSTRRRLKTEEDREIFREILHEFDKKTTSEEDALLREKGITF